MIKFANQQNPTITESESFSSTHLHVSLKVGDTQSDPYNEVS